MSGPEILLALEKAYDNALRVYQANKGTPSEAFDAGQCNGLKVALEIASM
jgi:hypothetical protein